MRRELPKKSLTSSDVIYTHPPFDSLGILEVARPRIKMAPQNMISVLMKLRDLT